MKFIVSKTHIISFGLIITLISSCSDPNPGGGRISFNHDWKFLKPENQDLSYRDISSINDTQWENISLPHTAAIEPLVMKDQQWTGICWYKKYFRTDTKYKGKHISILLEAAMNDATIWLNGTEIKRHLGGYLPVFLDISDKVRFDSENTLLIRLDNRNNPEIPPGKHLTELDMNYYSGIYRNAFFIVKDKLHFTDPMEIDSLFGGGNMVSYNNVSEKEANVNLSVSVKNDDLQERIFFVEAVLKDKEENVIATVSSEKVTIDDLANLRIPVRLTVNSPKLWSPDSPYLYTLETILKENDLILESEKTRIGIREIKITVKDGLIINGKKLSIMGTNRHQEYPYVGYALSDNAQFRDAAKIKSAGFNFVRSAHYPQSPAYLNACDELGILVMNAIPGWQFFGDSIFRDISCQNTREMCRRDRNHPSVIIWEASLNETVMPVDFIRKSHEIVHAELPFDGIYTCGWTDTIYDVFIPARQHSTPPEYWNKYSKNKPLFIAEYGSWEYYAQNAGFNQKEFKDLLPADRSSRQLRGYGEKHLLQQAYNFQEAYNSNLAGPAIGSANWGMFDYNRGYASDIETSGIMDIFRIPKFTYWFYKSQSDNEPVCFIASFNTKESAKFVRIYTNGDSVALYRNDKLIASKTPDINQNTSNLSHPPFTFILNSFEPGILRAESFKEGVIWASHSIGTPGKAAKVKVEPDFSGRSLKADGSDLIFIRAFITDTEGNIDINYSLPVQFEADGNSFLIGENPVSAEAGIATIILKAGTASGKINVRASSTDLLSSEIEIISEK